MNQQILEESFSPGDSKLDGVRKYGKQKNQKNKFNSIKLILALFFCIIFIIFVTFSFYYVYKTNQTISNLKKVLRNKIFENKALNTDLIGTEKELKILLEKIYTLEAEKKNMTQRYDKEINYLEQENEKLNNLLVEELRRTSDKFDQVYKNFENGYSNIIREIDSKCKVPNVINHYDSSDHSRNSETHYHQPCKIF